MFKFCVIGVIVPIGVVFLIQSYSNLQKQQEQNIGTAPHPIFGKVRFPEKKYLEEEED